MNINRCFIVAVAALLFAVTSCGRKEQVADPLAAVPENAAAVVKVDFVGLLNEAGCVPVSGRYTLTPALTDLLGESETSTQTLVTLLADVAPEADLSTVYWYVPSSGAQPVVTLAATDSEALMDRLGHTSTASVSISGYSVYTFPGACAVVRDAQLWIARSADLVIDTNDIAAKNPFTSSGAKMKALSAEGDVVAVLSALPASVPGVTIPAGTFAAATLRCLRSAFHLHASLVAPDGTDFPIGSDIGQIVPSFAGMLPPRTAGCLAIGALDWKPILSSLLEKYAGDSSFGGGLVLSMIRPYIESIDGTVAVAVAPAAGVQSLSRFDLSSWEVFLAASMPADKLEQLNTLISTLPLMSSLPCRKNDDGTCSITLDNHVTLTVGCIDGQFIIANYDLALAGVPQFASAFEGKTVALEIEIPYKGELAQSLGLPWGLTLDSGVESGEIDATVRINGITGTPLRAVIEALAK